MAKNKYAILILDKFPVTRGHSLIIPKRHVQSFFDLKAKEVLSMFQLLKKSKHLLTESYNPDGFTIGVNNGVAAGQSVMHVHIHLIPRYYSQKNDPRGGVRGVIPKNASYEEDIHKAYSSLTNL